MVLLDLSESNGQPIDRVIATKFPTYFVRHPNKVAWLMHQDRAAYELCGTRYSEFTHTEGDVGLRETLIRLDREMLGECRGVFTNARNTANRLEKFNGVAAEALYPPSPYTGLLESGPYGDYILSVGRVESIKRPELPVKAMLHVDRPTRMIVAGSGSVLDDTRRLAESLGVADRIEFLGCAVPEKDLLELYRNAMAIVYAPFDEDFGYVTIEAFLSKKPVITVSDARRTARVRGTRRQRIRLRPGARSDRLGDQPPGCQPPSTGRNWAPPGTNAPRAITWDAVIDRLLA